jgi:hypothetical protein
MRTPGKIIRIISAVAILGMLATSAVAGQYGKGSGTRDGLRSQKRTKDNSCVLNTAVENTTLLIAKQARKRSGGQNGTQERKRSKDGSCLNS